MATTTTTTSSSQDVFGDIISGTPQHQQQQQQQRGLVIRPETQRSVTSVLFSHGGQVLVSAGAADGVIKLWDVRQLSRGVPVAEIMDSDPPIEIGGTGSGWFHDPGYIPGILSGGGGGGGGGGVHPRGRQRRRGITALTLAPGGSSRIAAAYSDSHLAVFDLHAPHAGPLAHLRGHRAPSFYVKAAFSPDGTHLASGSCDNHVYVWQVDKPREAPIALKGHSGEVMGVDWCPGDFTCLASCADDDTVRVWSINRGGGGGDEEEEEEKEAETMMERGDWG